MIDVGGVELMNNYDDVRYEAKNIILFKLFLSPFKKKFAEIILSVEFLDHT